MPAKPENQFLTPQKPGHLVRARKPQTTAQATQLADSHTRSNNRRFNIQRCLTADSHTRSNSRRFNIQRCLTADSHTRSNNRRFNIQRCLTEQYKNSLRERLWTGAISTTPQLLQFANSHCDQQWPLNHCAAPPPHPTPRCVYARHLDGATYSADSQNVMS